MHYWINKRYDYDALGNPNQPYFTRLADKDYSQQNQHQGLLTNISAADLEDTDIYFYRQSTGQLVGHIEGLIQGNKAAESTGIVNTGYNATSTYRGVHLDKTNATFGFSSLLLGARTPESTNYARFSKVGDTDRGDLTVAPRTPWLYRNNDKAGDKTDFADKTADLLIPGEKLTIIAINRKTGYIGTKVTQLGNPEQKQTGLDIADGKGNFGRKIVLRPPNLKVEVTRDFKIQSGITKNTKKQFLIGSEGAGLTSDTAIAIKTIWLDADGGPLPESLPGYTARIAISTGNATEGVSEIYQIQPGIHTGVLRLPGGLTTAAKHFYVQVVGENIKDNANFATLGAGLGKLSTRPKYYVPVLVPIYNEADSRNQADLLKQAKRDGIVDNSVKAEAIYDWVYRPEMQFSVFDFEMKNIFREGENGERFDYIIDLTNPVIGSGDTIDILYTLLEPDNLPLTPFGPERELILAIGEYEIAIEAGTDITKILFAELEHFDQLNPEDYLTISLYQNSDSSNVLWEFAFRTLDADVDSDNNNGLDKPDRSPEEEILETEKGQPGKLMSINTGDADEDGMPNFADFDAGKKFTPLVIEVPNSIDRALTSISFTYKASNPQMITQDLSRGFAQYIPTTGYIRLWKRNGNEDRAPTPIDVGGDYLESNQAYPLSQFTIDPDSNEIILYVEAVRASNSPNDTSITIEMIEE